MVALANKKILKTEEQLVPLASHSHQTLCDTFTLLPFPSWLEFAHKVCSGNFSSCKNCFFGVAPWMLPSSSHPLLPCLHKKDFPEFWIMLINGCVMIPILRTEQKSIQQAGAELCQAQHSLSLELDTNKLGLIISSNCGWSLKLSWATAQNLLA